MSANASRSIAGSLGLVLAFLGLLAGLATRSRAALMLAGLAAMTLLAGLAGCAGGPLPTGDGRERRGQEQEGQEEGAGGAHGLQSTTSSRPSTRRTSASVSAGVAGRRECASSRTIGSTGSPHVLA